MKLSNTVVIPARNRCPHANWYGSSKMVWCPPQSKKRLTRLGVAQAMLRTHIKGKGLRTAPFGVPYKYATSMHPLLTLSGFGIHRKHESEVSQRRTPIVHAHCLRVQHRRHSVTAVTVLCRFPPDSSVDRNRWSEPTGPDVLNTENNNGKRFFGVSAKGSGLATGSKSPAIVETIIRLLPEG